MRVEEKCEHCTYYYRLESQCRRNPPKILPLIGQPTSLIGGQAQVQLMSAWPPVKPEQFCGEFKMSKGEGES